MRRLQPWLVLVAAAAMLSAAPAGASAKHHLKLKGVVTGQNGRAETSVSVFQGTKKVGSLSVRTPNCGGLLCIQSGTTNLKVGLIKGSARIELRIKLKAKDHCVPGQPGCQIIKPKAISGSITKGSKVEGVGVAASNIPMTKGATFPISIAY